MIGFLTVLAIGRAVLEPGRSFPDVDNFPVASGKGRALSLSLFFRLLHSCGIAGRFN